MVAWGAGRAEAVAVSRSIVRAPLSDASYSVVSSTAVALTSKSDSMTVAVPPV